MENIMKIDAVIFDLDGTLIDSMWLWKKIDQDFLNRRGIEVPPDYMEAVCVLSYLDAAVYTISRFGLRESVDAVIHEWFDLAVYEYERHITLKPYVREYLSLLKERGFKLGVATGSTQALYRPALENNQIRPFFDVVCSVEEVARGKDHPDLFLHTARKLMADPSRCLVFDDALQAVRSAKSAGMTVYGVYDEIYKENWEEIRRIADGVIHDFHEAPLPDRRAAQDCETTP
jgi:HAD superfamily hydrolase (TIGR01509 family)